MITTAPLLSPSMLTRSCPLSPALRDPAAPWRRANDSSTILARSSHALAVLATTLQAQLGRTPRVALPAWFCNASLAPLRSVGAEISFVSVDKNGVPDWNRLEQADIVVAVHVFGKAMPLETARAACDRTKAILVEDAAHVLGPVPGIGEVGDVVLYSPHKLLPLPDGAVMITRGSALAQPTLAPGQPMRSWLKRRLIQMALPDRLRPLLPMGGQENFLDDPEATPIEAFHPWSAAPFSLRLMAGMDLQNEALSRCRNALALRQTLGGLSGWSPLFDDDGPAPYRFVLRCQSSELACARYAVLRQAKLPVESWPDLAPEISSGWAHTLRRTLLLIPVHGSLPVGYESLYLKALNNV